MAEPPPIPCPPLGTAGDSNSWWQVGPDAISPPSIPHFSPVLTQPLPWSGGMWGGVWGFFLVSGDSSEEIWGRGQQGEGP